MTGRFSYALPQVSSWWGHTRSRCCARPRSIVMVLAATLFLSGTYVSAGEIKNDSASARYRVFGLRNISADKGKEYLSELKIGTVSKLPGANMLLVTAQPADLVKASAILGLVDSKEEFVIKTVALASDFPPDDRIAAKLSDMEVGTFFNPPLSKVQPKAIIDVHNDAVIAVVPAKQLERIISAVEELQNNKGKQEGTRPAERGKSAAPDRAKSSEAKAAPKPEPEVVEPSGPAKSPKKAMPPDTAPSSWFGDKPDKPDRADTRQSGTDDLFNGLLESLAEAEKRAAEKAQPTQEPDKGQIGAAIEKKQVPTEPSGISESGQVRAEGPQELDVTDILGGLEAGVKAGLEPKPEPQAEKVAAVTKEPSEAARAVAKTAYEPRSVPDGEEVVEVFLPEKLPITDFLDFAGRYLKLDFLYDPTQVKGNVALRINGELRGCIKAKELYAMTESVLQFHGYAMTRKGNLVTVRPIVDTKPSAVSESRTVETREPQKLDVAAILEKPQALVQAGPEPKPEPAAEAEKTAARIKELNQVAEPPKEEAAAKPKEPNQAAEPAKEEVAAKIERPSEVATLAKEEAAAKPKEPNEAAEPAKKDVAAKIEEPNQVAAATKEEAAAKPEEPNEVAEPAKKDVAAKIDRPSEVAAPAKEEGAAKTKEPNEVARPVSKGRYEPEAIPNAEAVLDVDLPEKLLLTEFLDFVGKYLKLDFLYDPKQLPGEVNLRINGELRGRVTVKELYAMMESVLQFYGFAMTRKGNLVTVRTMADASFIDPPLVRADVDKVEAGNILITRVFELQHVDTATAQNLLTNMKLGVSITPIPEAGTLIVTGYAYRMGRIEELLDLIDKPGEPKQFRFRPLKYTMAKTLAPKVKTLVEQLGGISITVAATVEAQPKQPPGRPIRGRLVRPPVRPTPTPAQPTPAQPQPTVYLDFDERTNRVLMIGLKSDLDVVEELISSLDVEQQDLRSLRLYEIQHVDAEEVRKKLEEMGIIGVSTTTETRITAAQRGRGRIQPAPQTGQPAAAAAASALGTTEEPLAEEPQVVIIESVNALLVNATPEQHIRIAMIIGYVDSVPEESVIPYVVYALENQDPAELATVLNQLIQETTTKQEKDAKIVTTTTTKRTEEDIIIIPDPKTYSLIVYASKKNQQWIKSLVEQLDQYRPQVLLDATLVEITKNDRFQLDLDLVSKFPEALANAQTPEKVAFFAGRMLELSSTKGVGDGFYADEHVQVILQAIQTKGYGRILARPKLLVRDNEEGTIKAEKQTTIVSPKSQIVPGQAVGAVSTTATSVELQNYVSGITLTITPHISRGEQLQLKIALNRTDFGKFENYTITTGDDGKIEGPKPPDLLTSDVTTVVTVPDNHTIILGGLEKLNQSKGGTKVPLLGDIPLLGGLFRSTLNVEDQSRLYVFVKAHIVRPGEPLDGTSRIEVVSRKNRDTFEQYEKEMQKYEDWPGIRPKPMDPVRVLDND
ncbi:MAG TPA: secretin N-terminal domain-containing protein [Sedimentisphaerales bacterium]|nr:secretin N-terminal domain-containing protein [Sedimentisphaerales bacterium]